MDLPRCCQCVSQKKHEQIQSLPTNSKSIFVNDQSILQAQSQSSQGCECSSDHSGHGQSSASPLEATSLRLVIV